ncbi:MAG: hypothetical protein EHM58_01325 [Ignavibacteriae bacterium]|nr:MAG: hypothetical protein EHM58_01325 [Ignavibacteriota bacterium]
MNDLKFNILHLSDLHFSDIEQRPSKQVKEKFKTFVNRYLSNNKIDIVICSGDVCSKNHLESLKTGLVFLRSLVNTNVPIVYIPGNHDIKRPDNILLYNDTWEDKKYSIFCNYLKQTDINAIRPLLLKNELEDAYLARILNKISISEGTNIIFRESPFYWDVEKGIFIYAFSSINYCGELFIPQGYSYDQIKHLYKERNRVENLEKIIQEIIKPEQEQKEKAASKIALETLLKRAFQRDIPFVAIEQLDNVQKIFNTICKSKFSKQFETALKIAVFHHPLGGEFDNFTEFPSIVNSIEVRKVLNENGFLVLLHGHIHIDKTITDHGSWTFGSNLDKDSIGEIITISAPGSNTSGPTTDIIQILEIKPIEITHKRNIGKELSLRNIKKGNIAKPVKLFSIDNEGSIRWINHKYDMLSRKQSIYSSYNKAFKKTEKNLFLNNNCKGYKDVNDFFEKFFEFIKEYSKGDHGVDQNWKTEIIGDFNKAKALYFIDTLGAASWARSALSTYLIDQVQIYNNRNNKLLFNEKQKWNYTPPVNKAIRNTYSTLEMHINGSQSTLLKLDICRILIWNREDLKSISGEILLNLHKTFKIPLFFIDKRKQEKNIVKLPEKHEYHLVFYTHNISRKTNPNDFKCISRVSQNERVNITIDREKIFMLSRYLDILEGQDLESLN